MNKQIIFIVLILLIHLPKTYASEEISRDSLLVRDGRYYISQTLSALINGSVSLSHKPGARHGSFRCSDKTIWHQPMLRDLRSLRAILGYTASIRGTIVTKRPYIKLEGAARKEKTLERLSAPQHYWKEGEYPNDPYVKPEDLKSYWFEFSTRIAFEADAAISNCGIKCELLEIYPEDLEAKPYLFFSRINHSHKDLRKAHDELIKLLNYIRAHK